MSKEEFLKEKDLLLNSIENNTKKHWENYYKGVDIMPTYYDKEYHYWSQTLDMNEIEYLKIEPMKEESGE